MKHRALGILLLIIWIIECSLSFVLYQFQRTQCRTESFAQGEIQRTDRLVEALTLCDAASVVWEVPGKEFIKDGILYDIITSTGREDCLIVECFVDTKETRIVEQYQRLLQDATDHNKFNQQRTSPDDAKYCQGIHLLKYLDEQHPTAAFHRSPLPINRARQVLTPPPERYCA